jgi:hypothetical protein
MPSNYFGETAPVDGDGQADDDPFAAASLPEPP